MEGMYQWKLLWAISVLTIPAADGAVANFKFEHLTTLGFAAIVIFLGRADCRTTQNYCG